MKKPSNTEAELKKSIASKKLRIIRWEKTPYYNYKKLFSFTKSTVILRKNDLENYFDEK